MLILSRYLDEAVSIETPYGVVRVVVVGVNGQRVTLGFDWPKSHRILREELIEPVKERKRA